MIFLPRREQTSFVRSLSFYFFLLTTLSLLFSNPLHAQTQLGADFNGAASNSLLGRATALNDDGTRVAIASPESDDVGTNYGKVQIYEYNGTTWTQLGIDLNGNFTNEQFGFSVDLNDAGNRLIVGATGTTAQSGITYIYEYDGTNWQLLGSPITGTEIGEYSGYSVSMNSNGDTVAIGSQRFNGATTNQGRVRIFQFNGTSWAQVGSQIIGTQNSETFGYTVAINGAGNRVIAGAPFYDNGGNNSIGRARIYEFSGGSWSQIGNTLIGEAAIDQFGRSVAMDDSGDRIAVGAFLNDSFAPNAGEVKVYEWNGSAWNLVGAPITGTAGDDRCGLSVAISNDGNNLLVGSYNHDGIGTNSGRARLFSFSGGNWTQQGTAILGTQTSAQAGYHVNISGQGDIVTVGAPFNDAVFADAGKARVFQFVPPAETDVSLAAGTLTITDVNGGASDDNITFTTNGANLEIANTVPEFSVSGPGVTIVNPNTVSVPLANITNGIILNTLGGTDAFTLSDDLVLPGASNSLEITGIENYTQNGDLTIDGNVSISSSGAVVLGDIFTNGMLQVATDNSDISNVIGTALSVIGTSEFTITGIGNVSLSGNHNLVGGIDATCTNFSITGTPPTPWTLNDIDADSGISVTNNSNGIILTGELLTGPTDTILLRSGGTAGIVQTGGRVAGGLLDLAAGGQNIDISEANNVMSDLRVQNANNVTYRDLFGLEITGLQITGDFNLTTNGLTRTATTFMTVDIDGDIDIDAGAGNNINFQSTLNLGGLINLKGNIVILSGSSDSVWQLNDVTIADSGEFVNNNNDITFNGDFENLGFRSQVTTGGTAGISQLGGTINVARLELQAGGQNIALDFAPNQIARLRAVNTNDLDLDIQGTIDLMNLTLSGNLTVEATGNIRDDINANFSINGTVTLDCPASVNFDSFGGSHLITGEITVTAGQIPNIITLNRQIYNEITTTNATGTINSLQATGTLQSITFNGDVTVPGTSDLRINSNNGVTQNSGILVADDLEIISNGTANVLVAQPNNAFNSLQVIAPSAGTNINSTTPVVFRTITVDRFNPTITTMIFNSASNVTFGNAGTSSTFTGNVNAAAGGTLTHTAGGLRFEDGDYNLSGLTFNGASAFRVIFEALTETTAGPDLTFNNISVVSGSYNTNNVTTTVNDTALIDTGAQLVGTGAIDGTVSIENLSFIAPGTSPGCLATGDLELMNGSTATFEINGPTVCTEYDQIQVIGSVTLNTPTLSLVGGYAATTGDMIVLIDNDGADAVTGTFNGLAEGDAVTVGAFNGTISYAGGDGNDVVLIAGDTEAPVAVCQDITVQLDGSGNVTILPTDVDGGSTDNIGIVSYSVSQDSFTCADVGPNTVTLTVADAEGNMDTCTATVTVEDNVAPTAICQDITVQLDSSGNASITAGDVDGGSSDNCGIAGLSVSPAIFTCADVGPNTVTLTVTDVNGNTDTCTATVTVEDNIAPDAICQDITVQLDATGNASIAAADIDGGSTDNCGIASLSIDQSSFTCADVGPNTVTLTVTDVNGNTDTCTATVTVEDNIAPDAICQDITVQLDATGNASIAAADVDGGSTDNCGIASLSVDQSSFTCADVGANTVTITVTDVNGNSSTCTATVTVEDNVAPTAVCQNITVQLDASGNASIAASDIDDGSTDNCGIASLSVDQSSFTCADVGTNTVTLTVTDVNGNTDTCTATVTVEDNIAPNAICQDITVQLDATGNFSIAAADVDGGSTDNCGIASLSIDQSTFTCADVGANTVTLTVTDVNGNTDTCTATVTVEDNVAPDAICQDITVQLDGSGNASITASDVDGGSSDNCGIASLSIDQTNFTCADVGTNTVTLTVTDVNGNTDTCTATVTVEDNVAPTAVCQDITVQLDATGNVSIAASDVDGGSTDNCGIASLSIDQSSFTCADVGANTVTLTVTDVNGNTDTCTATVTVEDNVAPAISCPADVFANTDPGQCSAVVIFPDAIAIDNCGIATLTQTQGPVSGSAFPTGDTLIEFTAEDLNGNISVCSFTVTVTDNEAPVAICQDITLALDASGNASITPADIDGGSSDNCGIASTTIDTTDFTCADVGANAVTLTVTDINGNISTCVATVTVEDNVAPVAVCQDIIVQLDATGNVSIAASNLDGGSSDACGIDTLSLDNDTFDCSNIGANLVTLTVTDVNGNASTCTATVTVEDNSSPDLVCMDITVSLDENGMATITADDVIDSVTDPCGIDTVAVDITEFDCDDIGSPITVNVFAVDVNGNTASCTATVTVIDDMEPLLTCPDDQIVTIPAGAQYEVPDYFAAGLVVTSDNCTDPVTITTQDPAVGALLDLGTYTVTVTTEDNFGNVASCDFELTVDEEFGTTDIAVSLGSIVMYPNPAQEVVYLSNPQGVDLDRVEILDVAGRLIATHNLQGMGSERALDISNLASATYTVVIYSGEARISKQLLRE